MKYPRNVGVFGGTFNPVHFGHLRAAEEVRERLRFDKILFIPSGKPPLKTSEIAPAEHRYEMLRMAVQGNPFFDLSDIECRKKGKAYTVETLEALNRNNPGTKFSFILGIDAFLDIPHWWQPDQLVSMIDFVVISRPGLAFSAMRESPYLKKSGIGLLRDDDLLKKVTNVITLKSNRHAILLSPTPFGISSTQVRKFIRQGKSIKYLLPPEVQSYIITHKLYKV
jgi:nicotinate-nucleotide adenylyltransferase